MTIGALKICLNSEILNHQISQFTQMIGRQEIACDAEFIENLISDVVLSEGITEKSDDGEIQVTYSISMGETFNNFMCAAEMPIQDNLN